MEKRDITCICCPSGCGIEVCLENGEIKSITGNNCKRGEKYAAEEVVNPVRVVTSTMKIEGREAQMIPVKTAGAVPKDKIFQCMEEINNISTKLPVNTGDVLIEDIAGTGISVVAAKTFK